MAQNELEHETGRKCLSIWKQFPHENHTIFNDNPKIYHLSVLQHQLCFGLVEFSQPTIQPATLSLHQITATLGIIIIHTLYQPL